LVLKTGEYSEIGPKQTSYQGQNAAVEFEIPNELSLSENPSEALLKNVFQGYVAILEKRIET
jgi:hypothetical protein